MADSVPKDSSDVDGTLKAVLDLIQFRNSNKRVLTDFSIKATEVVLTFKADP